MKQPAHLLRMKTQLSLHPDGTMVIDYTAETPEDHQANRALFCRYDGTGLIGSASGDGSHLQLIVSALTPEEIAANAQADAWITSLNIAGQRVQNSRGNPNRVIVLSE